MLSVVFVAALALVQSSPPGEADLAPVFGNTLVSTYPDGRTARLWMRAGGVYEGTGRRGEHTAGSWRVRDGKVCFSQRRPIPMPVTYCTPIVRGSVGARWTARAVTGETIQVQLVAGR
jgi:glutamine cyclotransferase